MKPTVSVVMTVYNAAPYLRDSMRSILDQSYRDLEFIIIDDGSTDDSLKIIKSFHDDRIVCVSRENKGVPKSSNEGIKIAHGKYIARQDADDISSRDRIKKQVEFLESHPDIDLVGTNFRAMSNNNDTVFETDMFTHPNDLKQAIVFSNQFGHGSTMMKKTILKKVGFYQEISIVHDYDLWVRISHVGKIANLKEVLYSWRYHEGSLSNSNFDRTTQQARDIRAKAFEYWLQHRSEYGSIYIHPFSTRLGLVSYLDQCARMYRNMALEFCYRGRRRKAIPSLVRALLYAPWSIKTYRYGMTAVFKKNQIPQLPYE
jgi:glycosyltransferase involved in cell wall biosynthesis